MFELPSDGVAEPPRDVPIARAELAWLATWLPGGANWWHTFTAGGAVGVLVTLLAWWLFS